MSKHCPVDSIYWQASQKLSLHSWNNRCLADERKRAERDLLPLVKRYAKKYPASASLLEIGCGPVCLSRLLPQKQKCYLDPMADDFRRMFPGQMPEEGEIICAPAERIPKPSASFDLILALNMIAKTENPELVMSEVERLLKPKGCFLLSLRVHGQLEARIHYLAVRLLPFLCGKTRPYYYTQRGIQRTLERHFKVTCEPIRDDSFFSIPLFKRRRLFFRCTHRKKRTRS